MEGGTVEGAALSQIEECEIQEGTAANFIQVPYSQNDAPVLLQCLKITPTS